MKLSWDLINFFSYLELCKIFRQAWWTSIEKRNLIKHGFVATIKKNFFVKKIKQNKKELFFQYVKQYYLSFGTSKQL